MAFATSNQQQPSCPRCTHELDMITVIKETTLRWDALTKQYVLVSTGRVTIKCGRCGYTTWALSATRDWINKHLPKEP